MSKTLRIATRQSQLAMWQAEHVQVRLQTALPEIDVVLLPIRTEGDRVLDRPLAEIGGTHVLSPVAALNRKGASTAGIAYACPN